MSNVAIVSTQMQLINCIELLFENKKRIDLLVVLCHTKSRYAQIKKMLDIPEVSSFFAKVRFLTLEKKGIKGLISQYTCKNCLSIIARHYKFDECILGNNFPIQNRFFIYEVSRYNTNCIFYVCDDGLASLSSYENRKTQLNRNVNAYPLNSRVLQFVYMFSGVNMFIPRRFIYFTIYNLEDNGVDMITRNSYSFLRSFPRLFSNVNVMDIHDVVFLGQPLLQQRIVSKNEFNKYVRFVLKQSPINRLLYVAHPQENVSESDFDADIKGCISIVKLDYPIETLFPILESKDVYSFYTSALVSLKYMSSNIHLHALWVQEIIEKKNEYSDRVKSVYTYLADHGIHVVNYIS